MSIDFQKSAMLQILATVALRLSMTRQKLIDRIDKNNLLFTTSDSSSKLKGKILMLMTDQKTESKHTILILPRNIFQVVFGSL